MEDNNALWQREAEQFRKLHADDTDEQLLDLLRKCAEELGRAPTKQEFYGSTLLKERFGAWPKILIAAGLKEAKDPAAKEARKQAIENKDKERRAGNKGDISRSKRAQLRAKLEYEQKHKDDTDEALLSELKEHALKKGRTPSKDEYPGSGLLTERFGTWREAVIKAGLELKHDRLSKRAARKLMSEEERRSEQRELTRSAQLRKTSESQK